MLGYALSKKGQLDEAIAAYREAIKLEPDFADAHRDLGYALSKKGQLDDAIAAYREAMKLDPQDAYPPYNVACAFALMGDKDQAFEWLEKAANVGYKDTAHMATDPDLDSLRGDPRYNEIIALMEGKKK